MESSVVGRTGRHMACVPDARSCGHNCSIRVYDPYLAPELSHILDVVSTSLDLVMAESDAVVCLAPLTPKTRRMTGRREPDLPRSGSVFVNVSRGDVVAPVLRP